MSSEENKNSTDQNTNENPIPELDEVKSWIDKPLNDEADFSDHYLTKEQKERDIEITKLLRKYIDAYSEKTKIQKESRVVILKLCTLIIMVMKNKPCK